jgi:hypothetical protein
VAAIPAVCRLRWLLLSALVLPPALPAVAMQAAVKGLDRSPGVVLQYSPAAAGPAIPAEVQGWAEAAAGPAIPAEVQGWAEAAEAAAAKGDKATALRLQKQVVAWLQANRPTKDVFRAGALLSLGLRLAAVARGRKPWPQRKTA